MWNRSSQHSNLKPQPSTRVLSLNPTLEWAGIDFDKIVKKTISVLNPAQRVTREMMYSTSIHTGRLLVLDGPFTRTSMPKGAAA